MSSFKRDFIRKILDGTGIQTQQPSNSVLRLSSFFTSASRHPQVVPKLVATPLRGLNRCHHAFRYSQNLPRVCTSSFFSRTLLRPSLHLICEIPCMSTRWFFSLLFTSKAEGSGLEPGAARLEAQTLPLRYAAHQVN